MKTQYRLDSCLIQGNVFFKYQEYQEYQEYQGRFSLTP